MSEIQLLSSGVIYRNPNPGHAVRNAYLPSVIALNPGEFLCVLRRGAAFYSHDGVLVPFRSNDSGASWTEEAPVRDPRLDERPYSYTAPFLSRMRDGSLVLIAFRFPASDQLFIHPKTGGFLPSETLLFRSQNSGLDWRAPEIVQIPDKIIAYPSGPAIELLNGNWFLPLDLGKAYDDPEPLDPEMIGLVSGDHGCTWSRLTRIGDGGENNRSYRHGRIAPLLDQRLFSLLWTEDIGSGQFIDLHRTVSDVAGRVWSTPEPTGLMGQTSWAVDLGHDRIFAAYSVREENPPGIRGILSKNGGRTWDRRSEILLWDATGRETLGVSSRNAYPWSHDVIAFGRPHVDRSADGEILVSFWGTEACMTQALFCRLRCYF